MRHVPQQCYLGEAAAKLLGCPLMNLECDTRYPSSICVHTVQLCTGERDGNNKDTPHRGRSIHCLKSLQQLLPLLAVIVGNVL
mmetsp:Transcript_131582/g.256331  ORF Transcript_131582/g.256331 Transcript_131582/m.256331 type:complete len:83 (+) Transcript_131582:60-308(+)